MEEGMEEGGAGAEGSVVIVVVGRRILCEHFQEDREQVLEQEKETEKEQGEFRLGWVGRPRRWGRSKQ